MMINAAQRKHSASAFTSSSNLNVSLNIGIAFIQRWRARQLVESWHLYRAVPGASSWLTANGLEQRLDCFACPGGLPLAGRHVRTLSALGMRATGGANPRRSINGLSGRCPTLRVPLMRHSVKTPSFFRATALLRNIVTAA